MLLCPAKRDQSRLLVRGTTNWTIFAKINYVARNDANPMHIIRFNMISTVAALKSRTLVKMAHQEFTLFSGQMAINIFGQH